MSRTARDEVLLVLTSVLRDRYGRVDEDEEGDLTLPHETPTPLVRVVEVGAGCCIEICVPTNTWLEPTPDAYRYFMNHTDDWGIGHLVARETDGTMSLLLRHTLLWEGTDPLAFNTVIDLLLATAHEVAKEVHMEFGGVPLY